MQKETKALSLIAAYEFGREKGLGDEIAEIRSMAIDGMRQASRVRRGYVADLFRRHDCLDEFIDKHWPYGRTQDGQRRLHGCERLRERHVQLLAGEADDSGENENDDAVEQGFALESQLRDFLAHNLGVLEPGLRLYEEEGKSGIEYPVDGGRIDVLAVDQVGKHVAIELKLSRGRNRALGQLLYYMGWLDRHFPNPPCRGMIIAEEITEDLRTAVARVPGVSLYEYKVSMTVQPVGRS